MTYSNNPNRIKLYTFSTPRANRSRLNTMVFIISIVSILWACYLTDKGYKSCLQSGKYSTIECEKLNLG